MADASAQHALKIMDAIRQVLFRDWDPIGVNENENLSDEYDSYIAPVYRLLAEGAPAERIAEFLFRAEDDLGMAVKTKGDLLPIATKLRALDVKLGSDAA